MAHVLRLPAAVLTAALVACTQPADDAALDSGPMDTGPGDTGAPAFPPPEGLNEVEPNDSSWEATPVEAPFTAIGVLTSADVDCYRVQVPDNGYITAQATGLDGLCPPEFALSAFGRNHGRLAVAVGSTEGCATLDAGTEPAVRYLAEGDYAVCVEGLMKSAVPGYQLQIVVGDDSCDGEGLVTDPADDPDGDLLPNVCDDDDDGDGLLDGVDNCPLVANTSSTTLQVDASGFLRDWLLLAPLDLAPAEDGCLPVPWSPSARTVAASATTGATWQVPTGGDTAPPVDTSPPTDTSTPADTATDSGTPVDTASTPDTAVLPLAALTSGASHTWWQWRGVADRQDFDDGIGGSFSPRGSLATTWVHFPTDFTGSLAVGSDDGHRVWIDDTLLGEDASCQGVSIDDELYAVDLTAGWHQVTILVHDHGGGWGMVARFLDGQGTKVTGLEVSLQGPQTHVDHQLDGDDDGIGDACDPSP